MSRELALTIMLVVAVALIGLMAWGWRRRSRRDAGLAAPVGDPPAGARTLGTYPGLYVATTEHGSALNRLAIKGLGFRSRVSVVVTDAGVVLDLTGEPRVFIARERIVEVAQATVTIDRVVERDGLTRLTWRIDDQTVVDSYLRPQDVSSRALATSIEQLTSPPSPTGTDS
jgi:hypothetical protein